MTALPREGGADVECADELFGRTVRVALRTVAACETPRVGGSIP